MSTPASLVPLSVPQHPAAPPPPPPPPPINGIIKSKSQLTPAKQSPPAPPCQIQAPATATATADVQQYENDVRLSELSVTLSSDALGQQPDAQPTLLDELSLLQTRPLSATSSMTSSPRRPRRSPTAIPGSANLSEHDFSDAEASRSRDARDRFEDEFSTRLPVDDESQIISRVLQEVDFRHLSDDEEILSDDTTDKRDRHNDANDSRYDCDLDTIDLRRHRDSSIRPISKRAPFQVGCDGCEGCERLVAENRRLRRQLDELEFEIASGLAQNNSHDLDTAELSHNTSISTRYTSTKSGRGWVSKFRHSTGMSVPSSKPSERARLKKEVEALTVTTEYLWRKLNKAELELRDYRLQDLRARMSVVNGSGAERRKRFSTRRRERKDSALEWQD